MGDNGQKKVKSNQQNQNQNDVQFKGSNRDIPLLDEDWKWHAQNLNMREFKVDHSLGYNDYHNNTTTKHAKSRGAKQDNQQQYYSMGYKVEPEQRNDGVYFDDSKKGADQPVKMNHNGEHNRRKSDLQPIMVGGGPTNLNTGSPMMPLPSTAVQQGADANFNFNKG